MPMSWAVFLRLQPVLCQRMHDLLGRDPDRGLYGGVVYRSHQPLRVGQRLQALGRVTDRRELDSPRGRLTLTTLTTVYSSGGQAVLEEAVQMVDLPAPAAGGASQTAPPAAAGATDEKAVLQAKAPYQASRPPEPVPATLIHAESVMEVGLSEARFGTRISSLVPSKE